MTSQVSPGVVVAAVAVVVVVALTLGSDERLNVLEPGQHRSLLAVFPVLLGLHLLLGRLVQIGFARSGRGCRVMQRFD